jgi:hypothetical protein
MTAGNTGHGLISTGDREAGPKRVSFADDYVEK